MTLDSTDAKILEILQENARVSLSELSKRINLSLSAASERLKKLEQSGIIKEYTAILNPEMVDRKLQLSIRIKSDGNTKDLIKLVNQSDEILSCIQVAGSCDYILRAATKDTDSLSILLGQIKAVKGVLSAESDVFLKLIKDKHSVPPTAVK